MNKEYKQLLNVIISLRSKNSDKDIYAKSYLIDELNKQIKTSMRDRLIKNFVEENKK